MPKSKSKRGKAYKPYGASRCIAERMMYSNVPQLCGEPERNEITLPMYARLARLKLGTWDDADFWGFEQRRMIAFCLARVLRANAANDATRELLDRIEPVINTTAGAAIQAIGARADSKQVYRATGDEINALAALTAQLDDLLTVSTQGHLTKAIIHAEKMFLQYHKRELPSWGRLS